MKVMKLENSTVDALIKKLVDDGRIIEAGWQGLRALAFPQEMSKAQESDLRATFFAGAQYLFGSIMTMLDPGTEATESDLVRMSMINDELTAFIVQFKADMEAK